MDRDEGAPRPNEDDDDGDSQLTQNALLGGLGRDDECEYDQHEWWDEPDPYDVDAYKILHFPGHVQCRGRNIVHILDDRRRGGARFRNARFLTGAGPGDGEGDAGEEGHDHESKASDTHLDVLSTPVNNAGASSPKPMSMEGGDKKEGPYASPPPRPVCPRTPPPYQTPSNSAPNSADEGTPTLRPMDSTMALDQSAPNPTDVTNELTSFAEYAAATKYKASYLKHLNGGHPPPRPHLTREQRETNRQLQQHLRQHTFPQRGRHPLRRPASDGSGTTGRPAGGGASAGGSHAQRGPWAEAQRQQQQQRQQQPQRQPPPQQQPQRRPPPPPRRTNPSPAVSTISISFSSDGRTLASTHGDHTVKITCCHTGKLLRTLEGHPRTPWTVKYHPANPRIVASGCLGYQVRVWDWNFQTEATRKARRAERERRWRGRYECGAGVTAAGGRGDWSAGRAGPGTPDSLGRSPRGVVEHPWRKSLAEDEEGDSCDHNDRSSRGGPAHFLGINEEEDDYAALALAEAGIPSDDPAWYDTQNEPYNSEDGIGVCLNMIRLHSAIISLSFHPSGEILAMASGSTLHLWDYNEEQRKRKRKLKEAAKDHALRPASPVRESDSNILYRSQNGSFPLGQTIDFKHESALRCVHFPPCGDIIIVGGVNPASSNEGLPNRGNDPRRRGGMSGGGMSFHLRMWDFDLDAVLNPSARDVGSNNASGMRGGVVSDDGELRWNFPMMKESLCNPRIIIPRVLLYNDGGFDLSHDGKILSACADFWLPEGVDSAMELLENQQQMDEEEEQRRLHTTNDEASGNPTSSPVSRMDSDVSSPPPRQQMAFPDPRTPPPNFSMTSLEPPSPPGKRNVPSIPGGPSRVQHNPHPLSVVAPSHPVHHGDGGRYVPHIAAVSLDTSPPPDGEMMPLDPKVVRTESMRRCPNLGRLLVAAPLDGAKSSGVTCVKLSPTGEYCLLGYGVRESSVHGEETRHPVTSLYNVKKGMKHVCTLTCGDDDVNIARFHPESGHGFVYGTKQGRVRVMAKRPWNYYET